MNISFKETKEAMKALYTGEAFDDYNELYHAFQTLYNVGLITYEDVKKLHAYDTKLFTDANK